MPIARPDRIRTSNVIADAIILAGSSAKLAKACGVSTSAITNAKMRGVISPELAAAISRATKGRISKSALRPDLWPRRNGG